LPLTQQRRPRIPSISSIHFVKEPSSQKLGRYSDSVCWRGRAHKVRRPRKMNITIQASVRNDKINENAYPVEKTPRANPTPAVPPPFPAENLLRPGASAGPAAHRPPASSASLERPYDGGPPWA